MAAKAYSVKSDYDDNAAVVRFTTDLHLSCASIVNRLLKEYASVVSI